MTAVPERPPGADLAPETAAADRLGAARGVLADIADHTAREVQAACTVVLNLSGDDDEREEAEGLLRFFGGRAGGDPCAKS